MISSGVAQVLVRNLDDGAKARLAARAKAAGRSLEAEVRLILEAASRAPPVEVGLGTQFARAFEGLGLQPGELEPLRFEPARSPFEEP
jgi:plasmid stability protein